MNARSFKWIGIIILSIIILTVIIQGYSIYKNYQSGKAQFISTVQRSLDNSLEQYYAELAKSNIITFTDFEEDSLAVESSNPRKKLFKETSKVGDVFFQRFMGSELVTEEIRKLSDKDVFKKDTTIYSYSYPSDQKPDLMVDKINGINILRGKKAADSISAIGSFANKIVISITSDTLDYNKLKGFLSHELERQSIDIEYSLNHYLNDSLTASYVTGTQQEFPFVTTSKSTYLPYNQSVKLAFGNAPYLILKNGLAEILFSIFFIIVITIVLLYLYRVISNQKALSEIKNDLINNITHEFKTPIATVSTAIEGISNFNETNDPAKTKKYLDVSKSQLNKLTIMVEKLLESATLNSEQMVLKKESISANELLLEMAQKFQSIAPEKNISLKLPDDSITILGDSFHLENAISNIMDNAIKYGGEHITISMTASKPHTICISDNGGNIPKNLQHRIFDQFYRIPKGNIHDVKGFGIGLYYSKKIIEKHNGSLSLEASNQFTNFIIQFP